MASFIVMISIDRLCWAQRNSTDQEIRGDTRQDLESTTITQRKLSAYRSKPSLILDKQIHSIVSNRASSTELQGQSLPSENHNPFDHTPKGKLRLEKEAEKTSPNKKIFIFARNFSVLNERKQSSTPISKGQLSRDHLSLSSSQYRIQKDARSPTKSKIEVSVQSDALRRRVWSSQPKPKYNSSQYISKELLSPTMINARLCIPNLPDFTAGEKSPYQLFRPTAKARLYEGASQETAIKLGMTVGSTNFKPKKIFLTKEGAHRKPRREMKDQQINKSTGPQKALKDLLTITNRRESSPSPYPSGHLSGLSRAPLELDSQSQNRPISASNVNFSVYSPVFKLKIEKETQAQVSPFAKSKGKLLVKNLIQLSKLTKKSTFAPLGMENP